MHRNNGNCGVPAVEPQCPSLVSMILGWRSASRVVAMAMLLQTRTHSVQHLFSHRGLGVWGRWRAQWILYNYFLCVLPSSGHFQQVGGLWTVNLYSPSPSFLWFSSLFFLKYLSSIISFPGWRIWAVLTCEILHGFAHPHHPSPNLHDQGAGSGAVFAFNSDLLTWFTGYCPAQLGEKANIWGKRGDYKIVLWL